MRNYNRTIYQNGKFNIYGLIRMFKKGRDILIKPTLRCNLACHYCGCEVPGASCYMYPAEDKSFEFWRNLFVNDIEKKYEIRQVTISGGEPFIYKDIVKLTHWLLDRGYLIYFFSNLTTKKGLEIRRTNRVKILATLHSDAVLRGYESNFYENLKLYSKKFYVLKQILVDELPESPKGLLKEIVAEDESNHRTYDSWSPDGTFYPGDAEPDKAKYDEWRAELRGKSGLIANPYREKLLKINDDL